MCINTKSPGELLEEERREFLKAYVLARAGSQNLISTTEVIRDAKLLWEEITDGR